MWVILYRVLLRFGKWVALRLLGQWFAPLIDPYKHDLVRIAWGMIAIVIGVIGAIVGGLITGGLGAIPGGIAITIGVALIFTATRRLYRRVRGHARQVVNTSRRMARRRPGKGGKISRGSTALDQSPPLPDSRQDTPRQGRQ